ncbi:piggyBac transposable element-derived protein 4-like [Schistocerca americana]|uniref:piggyBac transposable element-derived protein 4-like n=1 Tax=Schistocerca americana TaxID=7009 RepID=UPI001F5012E9|nr:piggyBac transposable element-derived protein 4-like [Schistocerca americana]
MKNKPEKHGIKLFFVCDSNTGYVLNMEVYTGKGDDFTIIPLFERLLSPYLSKGHTVYMDQFYTSPKVIDFLLSKNTLGVGTVMLNRKEMPKSLKKAILKKGEMTFRHKPHMMVCKWKKTRDVAVLSSKHGATVYDVTVRAKGGHIKKFKPDAVLDYNINKTGVDRSDQLVAYYPYKKKSMKW